MDSIIYILSCKILKLLHTGRFRFADDTENRQIQHHLGAVSFIFNFVDLITVNAQQLLKSAAEAIEQR